MDWTVWIIIALAACVLELFTNDFTFLMLGLAAFVTAAFAAVGIDTAIWQVLIYAAIAVTLVIFLRPWIKERFNSKGSTVGNVAGLVGQTAVVLEETGKRGGIVRIGGDSWTAHTSGATYAVGTELVVQAIDGASVVVGAPQPGVVGPADAAGAARAAN